MDAMIRGYREEGWEVHLLSMNTSRHPVPAESLRRLYPEIAGFHAVAVDDRLTLAGIARNLLFSREPDGEAGLAASKQRWLVQLAPRSVTRWGTSARASAR